MNQSEYKYYVYTLNGLLLNRYDYTEEVEFYGHPIAVSDNGQNYIFKKRIELCKDKEEMMTVSVIHLTAFGLFRLKKIDVFEQITIYLSEYAIKDPKMSTNKEARRQERFKQLQKDIQVLVGSTLEQMREMRFEYQVNDKLDICIRIKPTKMHEQKDQMLNSVFGEHGDNKEESK